jgi:lysophospholipase L1-like esterase
MNHSLRVYNRHHILNPPNYQQEATMPRLTHGARRRSPSRAILAGIAGIAALLAAVAFLTVPASASPGSAGHGAPPVYYLALGDSLSQGVQPATPPLPPGVSLGQSIETSQGYADDLYARYAPAFRGHLRLEKLGCPGETTTSMLTGAGSPCTYAQGSQLAAALAFLRAHRAETGLITIDIGANNVDGCAPGGVISVSCVVNGIAAIRHDLPLILGALRHAAGGHVLIAGMNLYDPFLADYLTGAAGQAVARQSITLAGQINQLLTAGDKAFGARTADVQDAFSTTDFTATATLLGTLPLNVARICEWTWMCAAPPVGPNIHANATGYQVIAAAFERAIGKFPGFRR